jgi:UDP:flavonoid glycosyltransferase YjiC (YdhE family)
VSTSSGSDVGSTRGVPNLHTAHRIPQRELLSLSGVAILHTGVVSLHECVVARVPVLAYPFPLNDQPRGAARVVRHGIGLVGDRERDTPHDISRQLDQLLVDRDVRRRLDELAPQLDRYRTAGVAVAEVEDLLDSPGITGDRHTPP